VAVSLLEQKGFKNVYALEAGYQAWVESGFEIEQNRVYEAA